MADKINDEQRFAALNRKQTVPFGDIAQTESDPIMDIVSTLELVMETLPAEKRPLVEQALDLLRQASASKPPAMEMRGVEPKSVGMALPGEAEPV